MVFADWLAAWLFVEESTSLSATESLRHVQIFKTSQLPRDQSRVSKPFARDLPIRRPSFPLLFVSSRGAAGRVFADFADGAAEHRVPPILGESGDLRPGLRTTRATMGSCCPTFNLNRCFELFHYQGVFSLETVVKSPGKAEVSFGHARAELHHREVQWAPKQNSLVPNRVVRE